MDQKLKSTCLGLTKKGRVCLNPPKENGYCYLHGLKEIFDQESKKDSRPIREIQEIREPKISYRDLYLSDDLAKSRLDCVCDVCGFLKQNKVVMPCVHNLCLNCYNSSIKQGKCAICMGEVDFVLRYY